MRTDGRFYLSYEQPDGDEYTVSTEMKADNDYVMITGEGKATRLARAANALLKMMGVSDNISLEVHSRTDATAAATVSSAYYCVNTNELHN